MIYNAKDEWNGDHLEHWGQRKNHRYVAKIGTGPNARYFYSQQELMAYRNGSSRMGIKQNGKGALSSVDAAKSSGGELAGAVKKKAANKFKAVVRKNKTVQALRNGARNQQASNLRKKQAQDILAREKRDSSGRARANRASNFKKISDAKRTDSARRRTAAAKRQKQISAQQHPYKTAAKKAAKSARINARTAFGKAKRAANAAYKNAKKSYNSKQGKAIRKKAKSTAKSTARSAYNRGRSFVKKLFKRK